MTLLNFKNPILIFYTIFYWFLFILADSDYDENTLFFVVKTPALLGENDTFQTETLETDDSEMTLFYSTDADYNLLLPEYSTETAPADQRSPQNGPKSYSGYSAISIEASSPEQLFEVLQFELEGLEYNFWSHRRILHVPLTLLISSQDTKLRRLLRERRIDYRILIEDIEKTFEEERKTIETIKPSVTGISFNTYLRYDFIMEYLEHLSGTYPEIANVIQIGTTVENRDITLIQIKSVETSQNPQWTVFLEAGMHGREWLGVSFALYIINQLIEHSAANIDMFNGIEWYVLPVLNADGYEYAHTVDRLWKTNRAPFNTCYGVDLNRNFDVGQKVSSTTRKEFMCTNLYAGATPASEPETKALANFIESTNITAYISLHSGDAFIAHPWGYKAERAIDYETVQEMALGIKAAIEEHDNSSNFVVDRLGLLCGRFDGAAIDWAKKHNVPYSLMLSLKGAVVEGFDISSENIYDTVVGAFEGIRAVARYLHGVRLKHEDNNFDLMDKNNEYNNKSCTFQQIGLCFLFTIFILKLVFGSMIY